MYHRLLLLFGLTACATSAGNPLPPALVASTGSVGTGRTTPAVTAPIATPGEQMTYRISLHGLEVGEYRISVGDITTVGGVAAIVVQSSARTSNIAALLRPVETDFASWIDRATGRSLLFTAREPDASSAVDERVEAHFSGNRIGVHVVGADGEVDEEQTTGGAAYDLTSFLMFLRGWEAEPGSRVEADVMRSRFVWRAQVIVGGYENLETPMGELAVVRFDGESVRTRRDGTGDPSSDRRRWSVWVSDDADRVPVRMVAHTDYGPIEMELVAYQAAATTAR